MSTAPPDAAVADDVVTRVLDAAASCFERFGVAKTSVNDLAQAAGVSRKTVYRYFAGGRDEIVLTVLLNRGAVDYERIRQLMLTSPTVAEGLVAGVVETIRTIRADGQMALLLAPESIGHTAEIAGRSEAIFAATRDALEPLVDRARAGGVLRPGVELDELTEWVLRLVISFAAVDVRARRDEDDLTEYLRRFLVPSVFVDQRSATDA